MLNYGGGSVPVLDTFNLPRQCGFAAAKYRASAIAAPKISRGTCRGNIACETRRFVPLFFLRLPRQSPVPDYFAAAKSRPRLFCRGKVPTQIILPRQSKKNNGTNRRVSQAILPRQVPRLIFGARLDTLPRQNRFAAAN